MVGERGVDILCGLSRSASAMSDVDMFGRDSDTTSDGEDDDDINIGAAEAVESPAPPLAVGRALFARAVSDYTDTGDAVDGGGETKGEDPQPPPPHPSASFAAVPVKTLPRLVYEGDKNALINLCNYGGSGGVDEARDLIARGINIDEQNGYGSTALVIAVWNNHLEIAQELIRAGAALDLQDKNGRTALMISADRESGGAIAAMLGEAGARCPGYKRSGVFNSKCKICGQSKKRHSQ